MAPSPTGQKKLLLSAAASHETASFARQVLSEPSAATLAGTLLKPAHSAQLLTQLSATDAGG